MKKNLLYITALMLALICIFASCKKKNDTNDSLQHTHAFENWTITKEAGCTAEGSKERYCACGEKQTASVPATGHTYSEWAVVKSPTETENGREERACACGEKETRDIAKITITTTVTAQEWKNAFDLSSVQMLTLGVNETVIDEYGTENVTGVITSNSDETYMNFVWTYNGESEVVQEYDGGEPLDDMCSTAFGDILRYFWGELYDSSDLGYLQFTYNEQTASYYVQMEIYNVPCNVNLFFENGRVLKLTIVSVDNADETIDGTYTYAYTYK